MDKPNIITDASWGLIPDWASHHPDAFRKKSNTLNARSESIFEKPTYRDSAEHKRCLILVDGFFEPHHENGKAIPYFCYQPSETHPEGELFLFAGLYDPHYFEDWLDDGMSTQEINELMTTGISTKPFSAHPVSRDFYKKGIDTNKPYIIEEVQKDTLF